MQEAKFGGRKSEVGGRIGRGGAGAVVGDDQPRCDERGDGKSGQGVQYLEEALGGLRPRGVQRPTSQRLAALWQ